MKKILCICLSLCLLLCVVGCGEKETVDSNEESLANNELSEEEKYNKAVSYIKSKEYDNAIEILEEIPNYKDSKSLAGKVHYAYGSQLFNEKDFGGAYSHFQKSSGYNDITERKSMVDYFGGISLTNSGNYSGACTYFKRAVDSEYVQEAVKHLSELTKNLLSGGWIGSCVMNGVTLQVEMTYSKSNNRFSLIWADRSNGDYKFVTAWDYGILSVLGSRSAFSYNGGFFAVEFDFHSSTSVKVSWSDSQLNGMAGGMFKRDYAAVFEYKIPNVVYPTMTIPDLFSDSTNSSEENISIDSSSQVETEVGSNDTTSTTSQTNNSNKPSSTTSQNSKPNNTSSITSQTGNSNNTSSTSQSSTPNNSFSSDVQSSKPNNSSKEQHIHNFTINATCEQPAKCECGETSGLATGHNWEYATCETPDTCKNCGETEGSPIGHDWEDATCDTPKTCITCGKTEGEAVGHKYNTNGVFCYNCSKLNTENMLKNISFESSGNITISKTKCSKASKYIYGDSYSFDLEVTITCKEYFNRLFPFVEVYDVNGKLQDEHYILYNAPSNLDGGDNHTFAVTIYVLEDIDIGKIVVGADNKN